MQVEADECLPAWVRTTADNSHNDMPMVDCLEVGQGVQLKYTMAAGLALVHHPVALSQLEPSEIVDEWNDLLNGRYGENAVQRPANTRLRKCRNKLEHGKN